MKKLLLIVFLLASAAAMAQQNFDTVRIRPLKIAENLYMLKGSGGNMGLLVGKDGTILVDDQYAPLSNKINGAIKTIDPGEIKFLINTHVHGDHSGGNDNFKRMGVTIVAHDMVRDHMTKETVNKARNTTTPPRSADALPVVTFSTVLNLHLNDEDIELIHFDRAHTDGDIIVHFKKANVFHTGDTFVRTGYPYIDESNGGSFTGYINNLDQVLAVLDDKSIVIPGHGNVATKADVKIFRDKLVDIRDQVAAALKSGKKTEDIPALGITDKYEAEWGKGFVKGKDFVLIVAENLKSQIPAAPVKGKKK